MIYPRVGLALTDCNPGLALGTHDNLRRFSDVAPCRLRCRRKPYRVHVVPRVETQNKGDSMKYKSIAILIFCASVTPTAFAQSGSEEIGGAGTPNFIARFTGTHKVGNSDIFQSPSGNIGIGTTNPLFPLVVTNGTGFFNSPAEAFVETEGTDQFTAAIRALAGGSTNNLTFAIDGVTFSPAGIGVQGNFPVTNAQGGGGVHGQTSATSGFSYGVSGDATGTTGTAVGVFGQSVSPD